ncbi:MAG: ArsR/SmtB family transcription factor [Promethearchaeota archaeon]
MAEKENSELNQKKIEQMKEQLKNQEEIVEIINHTTRIRILLLLWAYKEQSVNDLCKKLGKSWPTVSKHLEILEVAGLLSIREEKSRGPKNKRIYSVIPDLIQYTRLGFDFLKLPPEDILDILSHDIKSDAKTLEIIKKIFDDLPSYHEELERILREMTPTKENLEEFYLKKHVNYYVETLDEEEFEFYFEKYKEFLENLESFRKKKRAQRKSAQIEKPYVVLNIILPIREIQEARFKRFWKT